MAVQREIVDKDGNRLTVVQGGAGKAAVYGKTAAGEWVPLQVDAAGRAVLNVGEVSATIGVIEQGAAGEDPWPVQLNGANVEDGDAIPVKMPARVRKIESVKNFVLAPEEEKELMAPLTSAAFIFLGVQVVNDEYHNWRAYVSTWGEPKEHAGDRNILFDHGHQTLIDAVNLRRRVSDWLEVRGSKVYIRLKNNDPDNSHTYNCVLYGVW